MYSFNIFKQSPFVTIHISGTATPRHIQSTRPHTTGSVCVRLPLPHILDVGLELVRTAEPSPHPPCLGLLSSMRSSNCKSTVSKKLSLDCFSNFQLNHFTLERCRCSYVPHVLCRERQLGPSCQSPLPGVDRLAPSVLSIPAFSVLY